MTIKCGTGNHSSHVSGEKHPKAKLTDAQVLEMRALYRTGKHSYASLGRQFNCSSKTVADIITLRNRWKISMKS